MQSLVHSINRREQPIRIQLNAQRLADHSLGLAPDVLDPNPQRLRGATVLGAGWLARPGGREQRLLFGR